MSKPVEVPELATWSKLNTKLKTLKDEEECVKLLEMEQRGRCRKMFLLRIHSRLNYLRAHREREELTT